MAKWWQIVLLIVQISYFARKINGECLDNYYNDDNESSEEYPEGGLFKTKGTIVPDFDGTLVNWQLQITFNAPLAADIITYVVNGDDDTEGKSTIILTPKSYNREINSNNFRLAYISTFATPQEGDQINCVQFCGTVKGTGEQLCPLVTPAPTPPKKVATPSPSGKCGKKVIKVKGKWSDGFNAFFRVKLPKSIRDWAITFTVDRKFTYFHPQDSTGLFVEPDTYVIRSRSHNGRKRKGKLLKVYFQAKFERGSRKPKILSVMFDSSSLDSAIKLCGVPTTAEPTTTQAPTTSTAEPESSSTTEAPAISTAEPESSSTTEAPATSTAEPESSSTTEAPAISTAEPESSSTTEAPAISTAEPESSSTTEAPAISTAEPESSSTTEAPAISTAEPESSSTTEVPATPTVEPESTSTTEAPTTSTNAPPEPPIVPPTPIVPPSPPPIPIVPVQPLLCSPKYNYSQVLEYSLLFYEAQRSGKLPDNNRIEWRGDSALNDGTDVGIDLSGGYYDAGDHVKFGFPMAGAITNLAWGMIEFKEGYLTSQQYQYGLDALKWATDYFIKCHTRTNEFYGQVGDGFKDHAYWGRPEDMSMDRPSQKIDEGKPGSELAAETAAALAATSLVFREHGNDQYADTLLQNAKELYSFADQFKGSYHISIPNAASFYTSFSGYRDELAWASLWLYKATGEEQYKTSYLTYDNEVFNTAIGEFSWDNKWAGVKVLAALENITPKDYLSSLKTFMAEPKMTPKGLFFVNTYGANRHAANIAFLALIAHKKDGEKVYEDFARQQIHYMLGDSGRSFVVGFGENYPKRPHHRSSSCPSTGDCGWDYFNTQDPNPHTLYGALVGGPDADDKYEDNRKNFINNEVALDYNAGFQSAVAGLVDLAIAGKC